MRLCNSVFQIRLCVSALLSFCFVLLYADFSLSADLTLAWDCNSENNLEGYKIYYLTASPDGWADGTGLAQGASPITVPLDVLETAATPSFQLSGLAAGESYHFSVTAYNESGTESDFSNLVRYDVPISGTYPLTASTSGHGSISSTGTVNVLEKSSKTFIITADQDHHIADVVIDGNSMGPISSYTFDNIQAAHSIRAIFSPNTYSVSTSATGNSTIIPTLSFEKDFYIEVGEVTVNNNWKQVSYSRPFADPVVVATAMSNNDDEPAIVRIDNITDTGFEISVQEWDYLDDNHLDETIGYVVMEAGSYTLPDGSTVEAGTFTAYGTSTFTTVFLTGAFNQVPVLVSSVISYNGPDAVAVRLQNITATRFEARIQEQQANRRGHPIETVSYIAWEPCRTQLDDLSIVVAKTDNMMTHDLKTITFNTIFPMPPVFVATIQTTDGTDTAALRWEERSASDIQMKVEEEQSWDSETKHTNEVVGYFTFAPMNADSAY